MILRQTVNLAKVARQSEKPLTSNDLVIALAVDQDTGQPRYILQLDATHRGSKCNCKCPSCDLPLVAVNAAKTKFKKRPHFRHPEGASRERCAIVSARKALEEMFYKQDKIILPRRRRSKSIEGLSGRFFDAWVERPTETVRINECTFRDETAAVLLLDDGRQLLVQLVGKGEVSQQEKDEVLLAKIELEVDDPDIAMMPPEEIFARLKLAWSNACWIQHWEDNNLDHLAETKALESAVASLDWLDPEKLSDQMTPAERRETLLHREVKVILEREKRIRLPKLYVEAQLQPENGSVDRKVWSAPESEVSLTSVELEVHLGCSVPDVIATWVDSNGQTHSIFIEVTVTNPIGNERIDRLSSFGFPVLEIDIGRMGGIVTREEFTQLVVDEIAGKRWLYHPTLAQEEQNLLIHMKREAEEAIKIAQERQKILDIPAADWGQQFLMVFRQRWNEQLALDNGAPNTEWQKAQDALLEAMRALEMHDYPMAPLMDQHPLRMIIARILSIKHDTGVEYKFDNAWSVINAIRCDRGNESLMWHTLFLIAVRIYRPVFNAEQMKKFVQWREDIKASLENEETKYIRDTIYDRLLGLLFPEMRPALSKAFGTPLQILEKDYDILDAPPTQQLVQFRAPADAFLHGRAFDEWAKRNPDAAKAWLDSPVGKARQHQRGNRKK